MDIKESVKKGFRTGTRKLQVERTPVEQKHVDALERMGILPEVRRLCARQGIEPLALLRRDRHKHVARVRHDVWLLIHERFGWSTLAIGDLYARDHSTVISGLKNARERRKQHATSFPNVPNHAQLAPTGT